MNKKIWIGLASVFLTLLMVLGIQMINGAKEPLIDPDQNQISQPSLDQEEVQGPTTNINNNNNQPSLETPEIGEKETPEEPDQPIEPQAQEETQTQPDPTPSETPDTSGQKEPSPLFVTLSVSARTLLDKKDVMNQEKVELVPKDGWIFPPQKVEFYEGESAFNVLLREMKKNKIHMEYVMTPIYNSNYIEGIGNLYEFDCGELSGWMYAVNDSSPNLGTTNYILKDGDTVQLLYTCDLGRDLGFEVNE